MSDDDMVRRGDVMMVISKERQWASGCNPVLVVDRCIAAVRDMPAIAALPAVTPATSPGVTAGAVEPAVTRLTIEPDMTKVREALDAAEAKWAHLDTIAATIRVNTLRHGGTHEQADAFVRGEGDFVAWLSAKVAALDDPRVRKLVEALNEAIIKVTNDRSLWVPEWQDWLTDASAALRGAGRE